MLACSAFWLFYCWRVDLCERWLVRAALLLYALNCFLIALFWAGR